MVILKSLSLSLPSSMADEMQHFDSLSPVAEEGDTRSLPMIVSTTKSSSPNGVVDENSDSVISDFKSPTADDSGSISDLIVKKNGKVISFPDSLAKEEDQESPILNGGVSIGISDSVVKKNKKEISISDSILKEEDERSPKLNGPVSIEISDLIVKKNGKEISISDSVLKEEDEKSPKLDGGVSIGISDLTVKTNGKEISICDSIAKEEDQEPAKHNGVGSIGILGSSQEDEKRELATKIPVQLRTTGSLEFQVIDETALIGSIFMSKLALKSHGKNKNGKDQEDMAEKKKKKKMVTTQGSMQRRAPTSVFPESKKKKKKKKNVAGKMTYSREIMEALRFVNVGEQRKMWRDVHTGLGPLVRKEYDFLLSSKQNKNIHFFYDNTKGKNDDSSSYYGVLPARGRWNHMNVYVH